MAHGDTKVLNTNMNNPLLMNCIRLPVSRVSSLAHPHRHATRLEPIWRRRMHVLEYLCMMSLLAACGMRPSELAEGWHEVPVSPEFANYRRGKRET